MDAPVWYQKSEAECQLCDDPEKSLTALNKSLQIVQQTHAPDPNVWVHQDSVEMKWGGSANYAVYTFGGDKRTIFIMDKGDGFFEASIEDLIFNKE